MKKKCFGGLLVVVCMVFLACGFGASAKSKKNVFDISVMLCKGAKVGKLIEVPELRGISKKNIKITYSKKGVVQLREANQELGTESGKNYALFTKKAGTTTIKFTVKKKNGKKETYQGKVKVIPCENPFQTLQIDGKNHASKIKKNTKPTSMLFPFRNLQLGKISNGKIRWNLKSGWKVVAIHVRWGNEKQDYKIFSDEKGYKNGYTIENAKDVIMVTLQLANKKKLNGVVSTWQSNSLWDNTICLDII